MIGTPIKAILSAWPIFIIFGSIYFVKTLIRSQNSRKELKLLILTILVTLSVGELLLRLAGVDRTYTENNEAFVNRVIMTSYESPFVHRKGWLHVHTLQNYIDSFFYTQK
jgi:hypothetical protein